MSRYFVVTGSQSQAPNTDQTEIFARRTRVPTLRTGDQIQIAKQSVGMKPELKP